MQVRLKVRPKCEGKDGHVLINKVVNDGLKQIGEVYYADEGEKKWILAVLMERHPHVELLADAVPCDPSPRTDGEPC